MSDAVEFVRRPEPALFRERVERDVYGTATPEEQAELRDPRNVLRWSRVLRRIQREVEAHIAREVADLKAKAPAKATHPSEDYLAAKRAVDAMNARRLNFLRHVETRRSEAEELLGHAAASRFTIGMLITSLIQIEDLLRHDDIDNALGKTHSMIGQLRRDQEARS